MTYPLALAAACSVNRPRRASTGSVSAAAQVRPSAEPITTGCCGAPLVTPPTASQPALPLTTLVSWCPPDRSSTAGVWPVARLHVLPPSVDSHAAAYPFALPTATWALPCAATALTATCGTTAPGIAPRLTSRGPAPVASTLMTGAVREARIGPAVTTVLPPSVTATPDTDSDAALPNCGVCC